MHADRVVIPDSCIALQAVSAGDEPFLRGLHADHRARELGELGWPDPEAQGFLDLQFAAQQQGYATTYPGADSWIVLEEADPVGRLLVHRTSDRHRVVDVVVLTRRRGRGIGTTVLRQVLAGAADAGVPVRLRARSAPALVAWYGRLGFRVIERDDLHVAMEAAPRRVC